MRSYPTGRFPSAIVRSGIAGAVLALFSTLVPATDALAAPAHAQHHAAGKKSHAKAKATATRHVQGRSASSRHAGAKAKRVAAAKATKVVVAARRSAPAASEPLQLVDGKPVLKASVAYVVDQDSGKVLLGVNDGEVRPIASLTKLMTGMVIADAQLPMDERITITDADVDRVKFSSSRLRVGTVLTRTQALHLALMSSENRAAHALARTYPGGESAFVSAMNNIARQLGMDQTHYVEPTGLSPANHSSARDLAVLADAAYERPLLRQYSTSPGYRLASAKGTLNYVNTNRLVREGQWPIGLQKTGYIREAGQCILVQTQVMGRKIIMVLPWILRAPSAGSRKRSWSSAGTASIRSSPPSRRPGSKAEVERSSARRRGPARPRPGTTTARGLFHAIHCPDLEMPETRGLLLAAEERMPPQLDHLLIPSADRVAAARLIAHLFDVPWAEQGSAGPFSPVYLNAGLTLDFDQWDAPVPRLHYAFRVDRAEFDAIARV